MLMRYTAVALLLAALTASAVHAQSPTPKGPSKAPPEGQGWVEVPVKTQPGAPLRLSMQINRVADLRRLPADWGYFRFRISIKNISRRDIGFYTIRNEVPESDRRVGHAAGHSRLPG